MAEEDLPDIGEHPEDERARIEALQEEEFFLAEEGRLEFSLDEAVRLLVAHYGADNTRRHVTALLQNIEDDHAAL